MLINKGDQFGCYEADVSGEFPIMSRVKCHCIKCLEESSQTAKYLRSLRSKTRRGSLVGSCKKCAVPANPKTSNKCTVCCGTPSRRPQDRPCKCGEEFEQEQIEIVRGHMGCALGQAEV